MIRRGPIFIVLSTNTTIVGPSPNLPFTIFTEIICFQQGILCATSVPSRLSQKPCSQPSPHEVNYTCENIDGQDIKKIVESSLIFLRNYVPILNWKENNEASAICFEIRITRKKYKESLVLTAWKFLVNFPQNVSSAICYVLNVLSIQFCVNP